MNNGKQAVERVRFREQQVLLASDLAAEQQYHLRQRRRHNMAHHQWGIVYGLALKSGSDFVEIEPGMAVDGYGRELILYQQQTLTRAELAEISASSVAIWLVYEQLAEVRGDNVRRWLETVCLELTEGESIDPQVPPFVPYSHLNIQPHTCLGDDVVGDWPVYLGRVHLAEGTVEIDEQRERPLTSQVSSSVKAPNSQAGIACSEIEIGAEATSNQPLFQVAKYEKKVVDGTETVVKTTPFAVDGPGNVAISQGVEVKGKLILGKEDIEEDKEVDSDRSSRSGILSFTKMRKPPETAVPNQIYATDFPQEDGSIRPQLRIELAHPGKAGNPADHQAAFGFWNEKEAVPFFSVMTVDLNGRMEIQGDLILNNNAQLINGEITADPTDPRFDAALADNYIQSQATTIGKLDSFYKTNCTVEIEEAYFYQENSSKMYFAINLINSGQTNIEDIKILSHVSFSKKNQTSVSEPFPVLSDEPPFSVAAGQSESFSDTVQREIRPGYSSATLTIIVMGTVKKSPLTFYGSKKIPLNAK